MNGETYVGWLFFFFVFLVVVFLHDLCCKSWLQSSQTMLAQQQLLRFPAHAE